MAKPANSKSGGRTLRCAIYTRKSSEEGLEQDFNSLDAQREACAAFIASQRHEGWVALPDFYDDGGFSGGTMERPALQRLLSDIATGKVDVVVVYKVDRLTRALSDFAKIVEIFDKRGVSFVSVTQQFNTTSSMGRLTLNVLLSFAQFEREVTGERIRDKIAASKKKGMWMGGLPPLGYDVKDRRLVVNDGETETVRHIFRRYVALGSVRQLKAELDEAGVFSKTRKTTSGISYGEKPLARGALYAMLQNPIYRGQIRHKEQSYSGEHEPIIDAALWDEVQALLSENRVDRVMGVGAEEASLLAGLVFDAKGERMTPTHAVKNGTRYRYYVSSPLLKGEARKGSGQRIPAVSLEDIVATELRARLNDAAGLHALVESAEHQTGDPMTLIERARHFAAGWSALNAENRRRFLLAVVRKIQVHRDRIELMIDTSRLMAWLQSDAVEVAPCSEAESEPHGEPLILCIPVQLRRAGVEMRLVLDDGSAAPAPSEPLIRLVMRAHGIAKRLQDNTALSVEDIAAAEGLTPSYVTRLLRLAFIAPAVTTAILSGRQPPELTARKLMDDTRLPLDWAEQRRALGFA